MKTLILSTLILASTSAQAANLDSCGGKFLLLVKNERVPEVDASLAPTLANGALRLVKRSEGAMSTMISLETSSPNALGEAITVLEAIKAAGSIVECNQPLTR